jgi:hypothetical protein
MRVRQEVPMKDTILPQDEFSCEFCDRIYTADMEAFCPHDGHCFACDTVHNFQPAEPRPKPEDIPTVEEMRELLSGEPTIQANDDAWCDCGDWSWRHTRSVHKQRHIDKEMIERACLALNYNEPEWSDMANDAKEVRRLMRAALEAALNG